MSEWKPMDSAPADATVVILWWPNWVNRAVTGWRSPFTGHWDSTDVVPPTWKPTAWQPLPPPPEPAP